MKALFLDIDGVIQLGTDYRHDHSVEEIEALCGRLTKEMGNGFDYRKWAGDTASNPFWTVAAVYWDWNQEAIGELKRVLDTTGAQIVLSSSWRSFGHEAMTALFRIHGLDGYYWEDTEGSEGAGARNGVPVSRGQEACYEDMKRWFRSAYKDGYVWERAVEIREFLDRHPEVTAYAVVDDMDLAAGLEGHFVESVHYRLDEAVADALIEVLKKEDGPYPLPDAVKALPSFIAMRDVMAKYPKQTRSRWS